MLGLQVELELSSLEELVVFQFPDLPNILRYACDQEPSACPLSYLPALPAIHQRADPEAAGDETITLQAETEGQVLFPRCDLLRCPSISSCQFE